MPRRVTPTGLESIQPTERVTNLEAVRALADPLRLRILGALIAEPRTTKQVARVLGEKHNKLYYHVEALERAGLIRLTGTRPKRGAVERYYRAVAANFEVADSALRPIHAGADEPLSAQEAIVAALFDKARADLSASLRHSKASSTAKKKEGPLAVHFLVKGTPQRMKSLRRRLLALVQKLAGNHTGTLASKTDQETYSLTLLFCRVHGT